MFLPVYLGMLAHAEHTLADAFEQVAGARSAEADVHHLGMLFAARCRAHERALIPVVDRYGQQPDDEPERLRVQEFSGERSGGLGLLRDLQDLYVLARFVDVTWGMVGQAARGSRDDELLDAVTACASETGAQLRWLETRMRSAAPQALLAAR